MILRGTTSLLASALLMLSACGGELMAEDSATDRARDDDGANGAIGANGASPTSAAPLTSCDAMSTTGRESFCINSTGMLPHVETIIGIPRSWDGAFCVSAIRQDLKNKFYASFYLCTGAESFAETKQLDIRRRVENKMLKPTEATVSYRERRNECAGPDCKEKSIVWTVQSGTITCSPSGIPDETLCRFHDLPARDGYDTIDAKLSGWFRVLL
jgi:hypothetical protein